MKRVTGSKDIMIKPLSIILEHWLKVPPHLMTQNDYPGHP